MSRAGALILFGVLTIIIPFSGLPITIRSMLTVIFGACVLGIGLSLRVHRARVAESSMGVPASESTAVSSEVPRQDSRSISPV